jgi:glutamyl-tRNA synthetase
MGGAFLVRIEDTDKERSTPEFEANIIEGMQWLGLEWDGFARQSERTDLYADYIAKLVESGAAYVSNNEPERSRQGVVRFRNPGSTITFDDSVRGTVTFDTAELGDFVIARSTTDPLYHLAVVIDDHEMGVNHIIRGEDHISNTPRQILIQQAIGASRPKYTHIPLILAPDRSKLSKRHGATSISQYRDDGFEPDALVNYLSLLGWNPGTEQEIFSRDELITSFDIEKIQKGGAVFDIVKLTWFNREHIKRLGDEDRTERYLSAIPAPYSEHTDVCRAVMPTILERAGTWKEVAGTFTNGEYEWAFRAPDVPRDMIFWKEERDPRATASILREVHNLIPDTRDVESLRGAIWPFAEEKGKGGVLWPLRVALTGREKSPDPFTVISIIGPEEAKSRVAKAISTLEI